MQREIQSQLQDKGIGTKAQKALKLQHEQCKLERKTKSREQKEAEKDRQFAIRQEKKKIVADMIAADSSLAKMKMTMAAKPFKPREFKVTKAASLDYEVGDTVRHIKFGVGIVKDIVDGGRDYEVTVDFDKVGVKKMFAGFAKLKKL